MASLCSRGPLSTINNRIGDWTDVSVVKNTCGIGKVSASIPSMHTRWLTTACSVRRFDTPFWWPRALGEHTDKYRNRNKHVRIKVYQAIH